MASRTNQLTGAVWGDPSEPATITVTWDGQEVFSGTVNTLDFNTFSGPENLSEVRAVLCEWQTETVQYENVPVAVTVSNGMMAITDILANHIRDETEYRIKVDASWPLHVPADHDEVMFDFAWLSDEQIQDKYGLSRIEIDSNFDTVLVTPKAEYFSSASVFRIGGELTEHPGQNKTNVRINGVLQPLNQTDYPEKTGIWTFWVSDGTIEFDFVRGIQPLT